MRLIDLDALSSLSHEQVERLANLVNAEKEIRKQNGIQIASLSRLDKLPVVKGMLSPKKKGEETF